VADNTVIDVFNFDMLAVFVKTIKMLKTVWAVGYKRFSKKSY